MFEEFVGLVHEASEPDVVFQPRRQSAQDVARKKSILLRQQNLKPRFLEKGDRLFPGISIQVVPAVLVIRRVPKEKPAEAFNVAIAVGKVKADELSVGLQYAEELRQAPAFASSGLTNVFQNADAEDGIEAVGFERERCRIRR